MKESLTVNRRYLVIALCALGGHALNIIPFSYGILQPYVYSNIYNIDSSITMAKMHLQVPLTMISATGTAWTFGLFAKRIHPTFLHVLNGILISLWTALLFLFCQNYIFTTLVVVLIGFHAGQLHIFFSQRVTEEGRQYPSTVNGIYGFCFGIAGIWGNIMGSLFLNPWDSQAQIIPNRYRENSTVYVFEDDRILERVKGSWLILGAVIFAFLFPGFFFIGHKEPLTDSDKTKEEREFLQKIKDLQTFNFKEEDVFSLTGMTLFMTTSAIGVSSMCAFDLFKDYGLMKINDDTFFNNAGILIPIIGACGRILWGYLGDRVPIKFLFICGNSATLILQVLMYPSRSNKYMYVINCCMLAVMPGLMTLLPPSIKTYMGTKDIGLKYGLVLTGEVLGCAYYLCLASLLRPYLNDLQLVCFMGLPSALALIPTCVVLEFYPDKKKDYSIVNNRTNSISGIFQNE